MNKMAEFILFLGELFLGRSLEESARLASSIFRKSKAFPKNAATSSG
jgi:hypothetical protein